MAHFLDRRPTSLALLIIAVLGCADRAPALPEPTEVLAPSGLRYVDLKAGTGKPATPGDTVDLLYTISLPNGTPCESHLDRAKPFSVQLGSGEIVPGWDKGLRGMRRGGKRKITIPSRLAYGKTGNGKVPPNSDIVVEVEMLAIHPR
jgi:peptidylprolyl isomerase